MQNKPKISNFQKDSSQYEEIFTDPSSTNASIDLLFPRHLNSKNLSSQYFPQDNRHQINITHQNLNHLQSQIGQITCRLKKINLAAKTMAIVLIALFVCIIYLLCKIHTIENNYQSNSKNIEGLVQQKLDFFENQNVKTEIQMNELYHSFLYKQSEADTQIKRLKKIEQRIIRDYPTILETTFYSNRYSISGENNQLSIYWNVSPYMSICSLITPEYSIENINPKGHATFPSLSYLSNINFQLECSNETSVENHPLHISNQKILISNCSDFMKIEKNCNSHFKVNNNIDCTGNSDFIGPMCEEGFGGSLDGQNFIVYGLNIENHYSSSLFYKNNGIIRNLRFENITFSNISSTSIIAYVNYGIIENIRVDTLYSNSSYMFGGKIKLPNQKSVFKKFENRAGGIVLLNFKTIINCSLSNSNLENFLSIGGISESNKDSDISFCQVINTTMNFSTKGGGGGGIAYNLFDSSISHCSVINGSLFGTKDVGGICGEITQGIIKNCWTNTSISGHSNIGGILGQLISGVVSQCFSKSTILGDTISGGLIGGIYSGVVENSYSQSKIILKEKTSNVGGLVGKIEANSYDFDENFAKIIINCYSICEFNQNTTTDHQYNVRALIGKKNKNYYYIFRNLFYVKEITHINDLFGENKLISEMDDHTTFEDWPNFDNIWNINLNQFPSLQNIDTQ